MKDGDAGKDGEMVAEINTLKTAARIKDSPSKADKTTIVKEKGDSKGVASVKNSAIIDVDKDSNKENRGCTDVAGAIKENGVSTNITDSPKVNGLEELGTHADLMDEKVSAVDFFITRVQKSSIL